MPHIASQLSRNQVEELASYLSFLREDFCKIQLDANNASIEIALGQ